MQACKFRRIVIIEQLKICDIVEGIDDVFFLTKKYIQLDLLIKKMHSMLDDAQCKPPLAMFRKLDWFRVGEKVVCLVFEENKYKFVDAHIYNDRGSMYDGRRALSVVYDMPVTKNYFLGGYGGLYSVCDPFILRCWELEYLKKHLQFANAWICECVYHKTDFEDVLWFQRAL